MHYQKNVSLHSTFKKVSRVCEWLTAVGGFDVLLGDGEREEGGVLRLVSEGFLQRGTLGWVGESRFGCLRSGFQCFLRKHLFGAVCFGWVQHVHAQLLFPATATLEIQRLRFVEFAHYPGEHAMQFNLCHTLSAIGSQKVDTALLNRQATDASAFPHRSKATLKG